MTLWFAIDDENRIDDFMMNDLIHFISFHQIQMCWNLKLSITCTYIHMCLNGEGGGHCLSSTPFNTYWCTSYRINWFTDCRFGEERTKRKLIRLRYSLCDYYWFCNFLFRLAMANWINENHALFFSSSSPLTNSEKSITFNEFTI